MSYPYGALGGYDPYALMAYAGYGGYGQYGGLGMMPGYGGMGSPYMNYGNTYGGYGSPGYNLSYGKALVTRKRYSSDSGSNIRGQTSRADMPVGNCLGHPGCILSNN
uniref:Glycine rich superfamily member n=1 Tax=Ascaris lumbricoides TaxID=6252 RepID=A0A0M3HFP9_ASCLU